MRDWVRSFILFGPTRIKLSFTNKTFFFFYCQRLHVRCKVFCNRLKKELFTFHFLTKLILFFFLLHHHLTRFILENTYREETAP